jgi:hypothetical protein
VPSWSARHIYERGWYFAEVANFSKTSGTPDRDKNSSMEITKWVLVGKEFQDEDIIFLKQPLFLRHSVFHTGIAKLISLNKFFRSYKTGKPNWVS